MPLFSQTGRVYSIEQASSRFDFDYRTGVVKRYNRRRVMKAQCDPAEGVNAGWLLKKILAETKRVVILEETCDGSGIYDTLAWQLRERLPDCLFSHIDLGDGYVTHGSVEALYAEHGLDSKSIMNHIQEVLKSEN
jgi:hypothetical protein